MASKPKKFEYAKPVVRQDPPVPLNMQRRLNEQRLAPKGASNICKEYDQHVVKRGGK